MKFKALILLLFIFTVSGCTIYKKQHFKGYTIQWNKKFSSKKQIEKSTETSELKSKNNTEISSVVIDRENSAKSISIASDVNLTEESNYTYNNNKEVASDFYSRSTPAPVTEGIIKKTQFYETDSFEKTMSESEKGDYLLYLTSVLMALTAMGAIKLNRKKLNRITKWASNNPKKAQLVIAGIQVPLMSGALYAGYNLHKMGYSISDTSNYVFAGIMLAGFLSTPFFKKKQEFILNKRMARRRLAYMAISMSSLMLFLNFGNNVHTNKNYASITNTLEIIDQNVFPTPKGKFIGKTKVDLKETAVKKEQNRRKGAAAMGVGMAILCVLGLIFMACLVCMGGCSIVLGLLALSGGEIYGILLLLLAPLFFLGGIKGWKAIRRYQKKNRKKNTPEERDK